GAVPVERRQEREGAELEADAREKNARALDACEQAVASGGAILIFPEGTSELVQGTKLLPLRTGVARIAMGAESRRRRGDGSGVPVAVRYEDPTSFRGRARVRLLAPIQVAPYLALPDSDGAVRALTASVRDALEPSVLHVDETAHADFVRSIDALYGRGLDAA